jgi:hypothetical protein
LIAQKIREFYQTVKDSIAVSDFIIDFVVLENLEVRIVELNPFSKSTGPCLFDWEKDRAVIENGPLEIRVNEKPVKHVAHHLSPWKKLLDEASLRLQKEKKDCLLM